LHRVRASAKLASTQICFTLGRAVFVSCSQLADASTQNALHFDEGASGGSFDKETNLHDNGYRTYDSLTGRYTTFDPIGLRGGINGYAYAGSSPLLNTDEDGLAYFAKRPLKRFPWVGSFGSCRPGSLDDALNTEASHEHLFFEDGKSPSNIGYASKGLITEPNPTGYQCRSGHYNDCVMRKAVGRVRPRPYCLLGMPGPVEKYNCQDWAEEVRQEYARLIKDPAVQCECNLK
jgi:RHS repeat-associated protein